MMGAEYIVRMCCVISMDSFQELEVKGCLETGHDGELGLGRGGVQGALDGEVVQVEVREND